MYICQYICTYLSLSLSLYIYMRCFEIFLLLFSLSGSSWIRHSFYYADVVWVAF